LNFTLLETPGWGSRVSPYSIGNSFQKQEVKEQLLQRVSLQIADYVILVVTGMSYYDLKRVEELKHHVDKCVVIAVVYCSHSSICPEESEGQHSHQNEWDFDTLKRLIGFPNAKHLNLEEIYNVDTVLESLFSDLKPTSTLLSQKINHSFEKIGQLFLNSPIVFNASESKLHSEDSRIWRSEEYYSACHSLATKVANDTQQPLLYSCEETEDTYFINVEVPSLDSKSITLQTSPNSNTLSIFGIKEALGKVKESTRYTGNFEQTINIPDLTSEPEILDISPGIVQIKFSKVQPPTKEKE